MSLIDAVVSFFAFVVTVVLFGAILSFFVRIVFQSYWSCKLDHVRKVADLMKGDENGTS